MKFHVGGGGVSVSGFPCGKCPSAKETKMCHICDVIYCTPSLHIALMKCIRNRNGCVNTRMPPCGITQLSQQAIFYFT